MFSHSLVFVLFRNMLIYEVLLFSSFTEVPLLFWNLLWDCALVKLSWKQLFFFFCRSVHQCDRT